MGIVSSNTNNNDTVKQKYAQTAMNKESITNKINTLTMKEKAGIVCEHWFRTIMIEYCISVGNITSIIKEYYRHMIAYKGKFIQQNCNDDLIIINSDQVQYKTEGSAYAYVTAKLDEPIYMSQDAIYIWQMVFDIKQHRLTSYEIIGVVSEQCDNIGECAWNYLIDLYGISAAGKCIWTGTADDFQSDIRKTININKGDIITIELDCKLSNIVFKHKGVIIYEIVLPPRKAWYPAIGLGFAEWGPSIKFIPINDV